MLSTNFMTYSSEVEEEGTNGCSDKSSRHSSNSTLDRFRIAQSIQLKKKIWFTWDLRPGLINLVLWENPKMDQKLYSILNKSPKFPQKFKFFSQPTLSTSLKGTAMSGNRQPMKAEHTIPTNTKSQSRRFSLRSSTAKAERDKALICFKSSLIDPLCLSW